MIYDMRFPISDFRFPISARVTILAVASLLLAGCAGCNSPRTVTPLQLGDKVIFTDATRANEFRAASGNDETNTGSVVKITRLPATIETP